MSECQGSAGNVIAALASFFIPGLGQLLQGRPFYAIFFFVASVILWFFFMGWLVALVATLHAALYNPNR